MPADIIKSDDGEYKIGGLASTEHFDLQGESLIQKGIDLTPVDQGRGFFNFDHSNKPEDILGTIDGYKQGTGGLYVHGKLFKGHQRAEAVYSIMKAMNERKKGAVGMSVEGKILERDPINPKIIKKCQIKNVAITFNPVNPNTYASLVKSMSVANIEFDATKENIENYEIESQLNKADEPTFTSAQVVAMVQKALGLSANQNMAPADRSGADALAPSGFEPKKKEKKKEERKEAKMRKMTKSLYKSSLNEVLTQLQVLYPEVSRSVLWEAVKDRLSTKFPDLHENPVVGE